MFRGISRIHSAECNRELSRLTVQILTSVNTDANYEDGGAKSGPIQAVEAQVQFQGSPG